MRRAIEPRVSLITLGVRDLERARRFYRDGLGWPEAGGASDEGVAFFRLRGIVLSLYPREDLAADARLDPAGTGFSGIALAHNVRERDDVEAALAEAEAAGASILRPAEDAPWGGRSGYFADPDGHTWEVAWNPGFPILADGSLELPG